MEDGSLPTRRCTSRTGPEGSKFSGNLADASKAHDKILVEYWYKIHDRIPAKRDSAIIFAGLDILEST